MTADRLYLPADFAHHRECEIADQLGLLAPGVCCHGESVGVDRKPELWDDEP